MIGKKDLSKNNVKEIMRVDEEKILKYNPKRDNLRDTDHIKFYTWYARQEGLSANERLTLALAMHYILNNDYHMFYASIAYISEYVGCSESTVKLSMKKLVSKGYLERYRTNCRQTVYTSRDKSISFCDNAYEYINYERMYSDKR
ncbi:MAG: helix-turn-helix domain-containing protein [Ruminococcus sp.]|nr:helix-turn-helix domain-containing protein [Ruminococcus sp.]